MTTRKIVKELAKQGHKVKVYERPDGGLRITEIDGIKFPSSNNKGNDFARNLLNEHLSEKQKKHIRENLPKAQEGKQQTKKPPKTRRDPRNPKKPLKAPKTKPQSLSPRRTDTRAEKRLKNKIRRIRHMLKVHGVTTDLDTIWQSLHRDGLQRLYEKLAHVARKEAGLVYPKAVDTLISYIEVVIRDKYNYIEGVAYFCDTIKRLLKRYRKALLYETLGNDPEKGIYAQLYLIIKELDQDEPFDYLYWTDLLSKMIIESHDEALIIADRWGIDIHLD